VRRISPRVFLSLKDVGGPREKGRMEFLGRKKTVLAAGGGSFEREQLASGSRGLVGAAGKEGTF